VNRLVAAAAALAVVLSAAAGERAARAQTAAAAPAPALASQAPAPAASDSVEVTVVGKPADLERVRALASARTTGGAPLRWGRVDSFDALTDVLRSASPEQTAALRCWVDMTDAHRVVLYFAARGGQRFLVRGVELSGRFDELDRQSLAQVLELSISALLESGNAGISRSEARVLLSRAATPPDPPSPAPVVAASPPEASPPSSSRLAGAVFYGAESLGGALPFVHGPGVAVSFRRVPGAGLPYGAWAIGQYRAPATARDADVGMQLQTLAARAGAEIERWRLRARLGAGFDWVRVAPLLGSTGAPLTLAAAHWSTSVVVTGALALLIPLRHGLEVAVALSADVLPTAVHYDVEGASGPTPAFAPWRVRPGLSLELGF